MDATKPNPVAMYAKPDVLAKSVMVDMPTETQAEKSKEVGNSNALPLAEIKGKNLGSFEKLRLYISGTHTKREWLLLGERVFSHSRYAIVVMAALALCFFERYLFVLLPMALFFSIEWSMRFWLQKERGFRNRLELVFLMLDGIATISMFFSIFIPHSILEQGIYLRITRLFRGMYMLRMLRIFRFLTFDALVYSLPLALVIIALTGVAWSIQFIALYIGILLIIETLYRGYSAYRVLPKGKRLTLELLFVIPDVFAAIALMGLVPEISTTWVLLRLGRFLIMLDPLGKIMEAIKRVVSLPEIRQEGSMLAVIFLAFMIVGSVAVWFVYPEIDINNDGQLNKNDYTFAQVLLFVFRLMIDPGAAPAEAFTPMVALVTVLLVLSGIFFFALVVSLGSNVMKFMLKELANSSLSAREHLLFMGWNEQSLPILHRVGQLCARMQHAFPSVWIFHEKAISGAGQVGGWLSIREVIKGSRNLVKQFKVTGVGQLILFIKKQDKLNAPEVADVHHLIRDLNVEGLVIADSTLPKHLSQIYEDSLNMRTLDSASIRARMLYQMHHCSQMPELGMNMLDVISGETGLNALRWELEVVYASSGALIKHEQKQMSLEVWLSNCFEEGLNILAARRDDGTYILCSDLLHLTKNETFSVLIVLGRDRMLWTGIMSQSFSMGDQGHHNMLQTFTWPETWDLSMMFLGWHPGLPTMIEEMAERHHKLTCYVFSTCNEKHLQAQQEILQMIEDKVNNLGVCVLKVEVIVWDGLDMHILVDNLRGCKVIMFYPEKRDDESEDSLLELWLHEVATILTQRKRKIKWWSPPKLMVLPRNGDYIPDFMEAACDYPLLDIRVGSPDAFHDVFMARQLLTQARKTQYEEEAIDDAYAYEFMNAMLGDAVLVESISSLRLLEEGEQVNWESIYREALRRGWMLMAYLKPDMNHTQRTMFSLLNSAFPLNANQIGNIALLAGSPVIEMDAAHQTASLFFCRRGLLNADEHHTEPTGLLAEEVDESTLVQVNKNEINIVKTADEAQVKDNDATRQQPIMQQDIVVAKQQAEKVLEPTQNQGGPAMEASAVEGEVMSESVWPKQADKRLIRILEKQVEGSVALLSKSSEEGLVKLMEILDMGIAPEVEEKLMEALTSLQDIDRVSQRLNNVKTCLSDWAEAQPDAVEQVQWEDEVAKRYVMEEERIVLRGEL